LHFYKHCAFLPPASPSIRRSCQWLCNSRATSHLIYLVAQRPLRSPIYSQLTGLVPKSPSRHPQSPRYLDIVLSQSLTPARPKVSAVRYNKRACSSKQQTIQRFPPPNAPHSGHPSNRFECLHTITLARIGFAHIRIESQYLYTTT
jgi:hypothetical protein